MLLEHRHHELAQRLHIPSQHIGRHHARLRQGVCAEFGEQLQHFAHGETSVGGMSKSILEGQSLEEGDERLRVELWQIDALPVRGRRDDHRIAYCLAAAQQVECREGTAGLQKGVDGDIPVTKFWDDQPCVLVDEEDGREGGAQGGQGKGLIDQEEREWCGELLERVQGELVVEGQHVGIDEEEGGGEGDEFGGQREGEGCACSCREREKRKNVGRRGE